MATFRAIYTIGVQFEVDVTAENKEAAMEIIKNTHDDKIRDLFADQAYDWDYSCADVKFEDLE